MKTNKQTFLQKKTPLRIFAFLQVFWVGVVFFLSLHFISISSLSDGLPVQNNFWLNLVKWSAALFIFFLVFVGDTFEKTYDLGGWND